MSEPNIFKLSKPIVAYGEEIVELKMREATTGDSRAIKSLPYVLSAVNQMPTLDTDIVAKYISRLADIPMSTVDQIPLSDFNTLGWEIAGYFLASDAATNS